MVAREQFAWIWLVTLIVTYIAYFSAVVMIGNADMRTQIVLFAAVAIVQVIIIGTASAVIGFRTKGAARRDERDRSIEHRAGAVAYKLLISGMILVGCLLPFSHAGWDIFHAAVFAIALAEIVRHALIVSMYRRGWHA